MSERRRLGTADASDLEWFIQYNGPSIQSSAGAIGSVHIPRTDPESGINDRVLHETERERGMADLFRRMRPRKLARALVAHYGPAPLMLGAFGDWAGIAPLTPAASEFAAGERARQKRAVVVVLRGLSARILGRTADEADKLAAKRIEFQAREMLAQATSEWYKLRHWYGHEDSKTGAWVGWRKRRSSGR